MPDLWRILVVEDDDNLNMGIVNSLRKDGYFVQGTRSGAEAIRVLWSEEYDVVIGDLKTPGADGFEMLQWLRAYRPNTRMVMLAAAGSNELRTQALEAGVISYLEKPLNLHLLKEELRRLLQQTGFSASLNSFDLLDVIQIINMSRKNIALLVDTGLEERGILRFQQGELIWAEYGILRGEEAFFALAAYKNGTVTQQQWNEQIVPNVRQPLSQLIFQALQYRAKYAAMQQTTGEQEPVKRVTFGQEVDDRPFLVLAEAQNDPAAASAGYERTVNGGSGSNWNNEHSGENGDKEWWQPTGENPNIRQEDDSGDSQLLANGAGNTPIPDERPFVNRTNIVPSTVHKTPASQRADLPEWLTDQPTMSDIPALRPSSLSNTTQVPSVSGTKPPPAEWQPTPSLPKTTEQLSRKQATGAQKPIAKNRHAAAGARPSSSPEWQPPQPEGPSQPPGGSLQSLSLPRKTNDLSHSNGEQKSGPLSSTAKVSAQRNTKRNYPALVAALQTLGYSITGFIAAAVVGLDGQPVAQVAIDDLDISPVCGYFSSILQGALHSLELGKWGAYEHTLLSSADRYILLRLISSNKDAFQVLITTRESDPLESLEVMANVEGAIAAALP